MLVLLAARLSVTTQAADVDEALLIYVCNEDLIDLNVGQWTPLLLVDRIHEHEAIVETVSTGS